MKKTPRDPEAPLFDLCVVGAGMFGSAAARHASANPALRVCLIGPNEPTAEERQTREIFGAHYDEGRMVQMVAEKRPMQILVKHTVRRFQELQRLSGIQFYTPMGMLFAAEQDDEYMMDALQCLHIHDVPFVDLTDGDVFKKRFPFINMDDSDTKIFEDYGAGYVSARKLVQAEKEVARAQGCTLIEDIAKSVTKWPRSGGGDGHQEIEISLEEHGPVFTKRVLLCTGAFTDLEDSRLLPHWNFELTMNKECVVMLKLSTEDAKRLSSMPPIIYHKNADDMLIFSGAYILPPIRYPDGEFYLKAGPLQEAALTNVKTLKEARDWFNCKGDPQFLAPLESLLRKVFPDIRPTGITSNTCLTTHTPSGLPYIDRVDPSVTVAIAGNGTGAASCDEVGRIAAELSLTGKWTSEIPRELFYAKKRCR